MCFKSVMYLTTNSLSYSEIQWVQGGTWIFIMTSQQPSFIGLSVLPFSLVTAEAIITK